MHLGKLFRSCLAAILVFASPLSFADTDTPTGKNGDSAATESGNTKSAKEHVGHHGAKGKKGKESEQGDSNKKDANSEPASPSAGGGW